jgi:hypothetical protein
LAQETMRRTAEQDQSRNRADWRRNARLRHEAQTHHAALPSLVGWRQFTIACQRQQVVLQALAVESVESGTRHWQHLAV